MHVASSETSEKLICLRRHKFHFVTFVLQKLHNALVTDDVSCAHHYKIRLFAFKEAADVFSHRHVAVINQLLHQRFRPFIFLLEGLQQCVRVSAEIGLLHFSKKFFCFAGLL